VTGQRKALIVASDEYEQEGLRHLLAPAADAEALGRVLGDPQIGGFAVQVVRNEPAHLIQAQIEDLLSESRPEDVLLLHFSCHGLKSESGELFFAACNTRPSRLGSTAIPADFVQRCMRASRSRSIVLLLDCCYGGAFARGVTVRAGGDVNVLEAFPGGKLGGGRGRAVITASSAMEYAFEADRLAGDHSLRPSVFTGALVEGLATGDADRDEDGWVSLNELYDYVFDKVREQNPHQTPGRDVEMQGELYLARSRRRRIRAAPIPPDLDAARADPNMFARLGAVTELRSRLGGDDLPTAAGALAVLTEMARTDIQFVADAAQAALREAAVHPAETELHFGRLVQGSPPPHRTVRLPGPPIARACTPEASHQWIRVNETAGGFDVSIDTAQAGTLRGTLNFRGPTGEALVTIDADVFPPPPQTHPPPTGEPADDAMPGSAPPPPHVAEAPAAATPPAHPLPASPAASPTSPPQPGNVATGGTSESASPVPGPSTTPEVSSPRRTRRGKGAGILRVLWALIPALSLGLLTPVPFAHAAVRLRDRRLWTITSAYTIAWVTLWITFIAIRPNLEVDDPSRDVHPWWFYLWLAFTVVPTIHAFRLRHRVFAPPSPPASQ
jgi:Caspase domain